MTDPKPILLFDLDGTLIDSAPDLVETMNTILRRHGRTTLPIDAAKKLVGDGARALLDRGFKQTGAPASAEQLDALFTEFLEIYVPNCAVLSRPFEGVTDALDSFAKAGYRMGVCTNKPQAPSETILTELGLMPYFEAVVGGDYFPVRKPDPQHLLGALELMEASGQSAIMVGVLQRRRGRRNADCGHPRDIRLHDNPGRVARRRYSRRSLQHIRRPPHA